MEMISEGVMERKEGGWWTEKEELERKRNPLIGNEFLRHKSAPPSPP